jgi:hypothetical protein
MHVLFCNPTSVSVIVCLHVVFFCFFFFDYFQNAHARSPFEFIILRSRYSRFTTGAGQPHDQPGPCPSRHDRFALQLASVHVCVCIIMCVRVHVYICVCVCVCVLYINYMKCVCVCVANEIMRHAVALQLDGS